MKKDFESKATTIWEEKQLYGYFKRQIDEMEHKMIWTWLRIKKLSPDSNAK